MVIKRTLNFSILSHLLNMKNFRVDKDADGRITIEEVKEVWQKESPKVKLISCDFCVSLSGHFRN